MVLGPGCDGESTSEKIINALKTENSVGSLLGVFEMSKEIELMSEISTKFLDNDRTPNIISNAYFSIMKNPDNQYKCIKIERHIKPLVPLKWLIQGLIFDGNKFKG